MLKYAVSQGYITINPVAKVPTKALNNKIVRYLSDTERQGLLAACRKSSWKPLYRLVLLAMTTGMRKQARHYFCESLFWASQPKQAAKITWQLMPTAPQFVLYKINLDQVFAGEVEYQKLAAPLLELNSIWLRFQLYNIILILKYKISGY
jgi:hypothetical protein